MTLDAANKLPMAATKTKIALTEEALYSRIYVIRKQKVMLDFHLAELYQVQTKVLNQAVKRNVTRFPKDFMFQLSHPEWRVLRSQFVTLDTGRGQYSKYLPFAFTEQGVSMLSSVLNSQRAISVNIQIMRIFVKMRAMILSYKRLLKKIEKIEGDQLKNQKEISSIYKIIKNLLEPTFRVRRAIGFRLPSKE